MKRKRPSAIKRMGMTKFNVQFSAICGTLDLNPAFLLSCGCG